MISAGARKDLLVLEFAQALLKVSSDESVFADEDIVSRTAKANYHLNKRIERGVNKFVERMQSTIDTLIRRDGEPLARWIRTRLDSRVAPVLKSITSKTVNLEMLALWIMFVNFSERDKTLLEEFKEYENAAQYFRVIELLGGTEVARLEGELFEEAYKLVAALKR